MTFIEEELKTLESSPDYRRFLKVFIKYQIYTLFQKLSDIGEESFALTANASDGTFSHVGSSKGEVFLDKTQDLQWKFLSFCSSTETLPNSYEVIPVSSRDPSPHTVDPAYRDDEASVMRQTQTHVYNNDKETAVFQSDDVTVYKEAEEEEGVYEEHEEQDSNDYGEEEPTEQGDGTSVHCGYKQIYMEQCHLTSARGKRPRKRGRFTIRLDNLPYSGDGAAAILSDGQHTGDQAVAETMMGNPHLETENSIVHINESMPTNNNSMKLKIITPASADVSYDGLESCSSPYPIKTEPGIEQEDRLNAFGYVEHIEDQHQNITGVPRGSVDLLTNKYHPESPSVYLDVSQSEDSPDKHSGRQLYRVGDVYKCPECKNIFRAFSQLAIHLRTHTGERPYTCKVCRRAFKRLEHLTRHMRTHTGEKPYKCHMCDKAFTQDGALKQHVMTHLNLRLHQCPICDKRFNYKGSLKSHMKSCDKNLNLTLS